MKKFTLRNMESHPSYNMIFDIMINREIVGLVRLNSSGIYIRLDCEEGRIIKIGTYHKTWVSEQTIRKHVRSAIKMYFNICRSWIF